MRKAVLSLLVGILFGATTVLAAEKTWTGKISDSSCGRSHKAAIEHGKRKMSDADCTKACVKNGGKYVFVAGSKIYNISNQDLADLETHAGHRVRLTGEMTGDTIKVSKIEMPGKSKKKAA